MASSQCLRIRRISRVCLPHWLELVFLAMNFCTDLGSSQNTEGPHFILPFPVTSMGDTQDLPINMWIHVLPMSPFTVVAILTLLSPDKKPGLYASATIDPGGKHCFNYIYNTLSQPPKYEELMEMSALELNTTGNVSVSVEIKRYHEKQLLCSGLYQALPVSSWSNRYFPQTRRVPSYLILFSFMANTISVARAEMSTVEGANYTLTRKGAFLLAVQEGLLGLIVNGKHPFGIIYGSMGPQEFTTDSGLPYDWFGSIYKVPIVPFKPNIEDISVLVTAIEASNRTHVVYFYVNNKDLLLRFPGSSEVVQLQPVISVQKQDNEIVMPERLRLSCYGCTFAVSIVRKYEEGGQSVMTLIPELLYRSSFIFRPLENFTTFHMQMVSRYEFDIISIPESLKDTAEITTHSGSGIRMYQWKVVHPGDIIIAIQSMLCSQRFALYVIYYSPNNAIAFSPGLSLNSQLRDENHRQNCLSTETPYWEDLIDNDCDGKIDEENLDGIDNDDDNVTDEDICVNITASGEWTSWESWGHCDLANCRYIRRRWCKNPYPGPQGQTCSSGEFEETEELKFVGCVGSDLICPMDCPLGTYSALCKPCDPNCVNCDRLTGYCKACKNGTSSVGATCMDCPRGHFGLNCQSSCKAECLITCDPVNGTCPPLPDNKESDVSDSVLQKYLPYILSAIASVVLICLVCLSLTRKNDSSMKLTMTTLYSENDISMSKSTNNSTAISDISNVSI